MRAESHSSLRSFLAAAVLAAAASPLLAQGFAERAEVVVVEVPVQVVRDGQPVRGLTADDFEIWEGRRRRPITGFEVVDLADPSAGRREVPAAARRHFLLLFDLSFSQPSSVVKAREAARDLVLGLHASDLVAVATYHASRGPNLVLGFSSDRRQIDAALEGLGLTGKDAAQDPLRLVLRDAAPAEEMARTPQGRVGGLRDQPWLGDTSGSSMVQQIQAIADPAGRADLETQRNAVTALSRSFADLARLMGSVEGRKHVVYLSEGFDSRLLRGTDDLQKRDEIAAASQSGEFWKVEGDELYGNTKTVNEVERMLEEFRRADCAIQAVDIGGLRGEGSASGAEAAGGTSGGTSGGKDSLLQMARGTGGELYENLNDLSSAMDRMLGRTSVTYVLAYQPDDLRADGSYRRLRVELKNGRGARLVHRPGFYAPKPYRDRNPFERLLEAGARVVSGDDAGTLDLAVLAAAFRSGVRSGRAYVPVLIEVGGPGLLAGSQGKTLPAEIYIYAMDAEGGIPDFSTQTIGLDLARAEAGLRQSGLKFFGHLELPPGRYTVRVLVRNGDTGEAGLRIVELEVPAFDPSDPVLLPPFFPEPPGKWVMARERPRGGQQEAPYPFMMRDQPFVPASRPVLGPGEEAAVALLGYHLGQGEVESQILGADGAEVAAGGVRVLERASGSGPGSGPDSGPDSGPEYLRATFRPPDLQPGEYRLRVTLRGPEGTAETSTIPFVIGRKTGP